MNAEDQEQMNHFIGTAMERVDLLIRIFGKSPVLEVINSFKSISEEVVDNANDAIKAARNLQPGDRDSKWAGISDENRIAVRKLLIETISMVGTLSLLRLFQTMLAISEKEFNENRDKEEPCL
jgi:hypothetical protein